MIGSVAPPRLGQARFAAVPGRGRAGIVTALARRLALIQQG